MRPATATATVPTEDHQSQAHGEPSHATDFHAAMRLDLGNELFWKALARQKGAYLLAMRLLARNLDEFTGYQADAKDHQNHAHGEQRGGATSRPTKQGRGEPHLAAIPGLDVDHMFPFARWNRRAV